MLIATLCASCATNKDRVNEAYVQKAVAEDAGKTQELIEQAKALRVLPDAPAECALRVRSSVAIGDRMDVVALKLDSALSKANNRIVACNEFWSKIKASRLETPLKGDAVER